MTCRTSPDNSTEAATNTMASQLLPCIAVTPGEPAGIGPDILIQLLQQPLNANLVVFADPDVLQLRAKQLRQRILFEILELGAFMRAVDSGKKLSPIIVIPEKTRVSVVAGELSRFNADYVLQTLTLAAQSCLDGYCHALVTGPVHKGIINDAGIKFSGHTEYLAKLTQATLPVMMLQVDDFRVALATTHLPLNQVSANITPERLKQVLSILHNDLVNRYRIKNPTIVVAGLNPHAGEGGHLGTEEKEVITPVLDLLRTEGFNLLGPLSADTMFIEYQDKADAFLAMFHDQGLPVLKFKGFHKAVNVTLGLPIIRTSVDHGTALGIAGSGKSDCSSLHAAINTAIQLAKR